MQQEIDIQGRSCWTETFGDQSSPALVLIAGAGASAFFWSEGFCDQLAGNGFFVIRYDHRDTGLSTSGHFEEAPYTLDDLAEDVIGIMDHFSIEKAHIVGHAMGGFIAQFLAVNHPERLLSITCISSAAAGAPTSLPETISKVERDQMSRTWEVMLSNNPTANYEESVSGFMKVWHYLMGERELDEELAKSYLEDIYHRSHRGVSPHKEHMSVMQEVGKSIGQRVRWMERIKTRTLVIHGEQDHLIPFTRGGKVLGEEIKGAKVVIVPKMGHMLFNRELEGEIAQLILKFISK